MDHAFQTLMTRFDEAQSLDDLRDALFKYLRFTGFLQYGYYTYDAGPRRRSPLLISNYSPEWLDHYMSNDYARFDPVFQEAESSLLPFTWSSEMPKENWHPKGIDILNEAKSANIVHGVSIPFQVFQGRTGAMTFASDLPKEEFFEIYQNSKNALNLVAMYFHAHVQRLTIQRDERQIHLTEREYEILYQCVRGLDVEQIGEILKISVGTVRVHIKNINTKYGTKSIRNACVMAVANLDIDLPTQELLGVRTAN